MMRKIFLFCAFYQVGFAQIKARAEVDQEALIQCAEIHPSPIMVSFAFYENSGCKLKCVLSNGIVTEDRVIQANEGAECGKNGLCDGSGECHDSPLQPYGDPAKAWSSCQRVHRGIDQQLPPIEMDGGCEILCRREKSNHTIYRNKLESCGPDMVCVDGACVLDQATVSEKIDWLLDGINGTILCRHKSPYYRFGDLKQFGCQLKCIPSFGAPMVYSRNEGENCHYAGKCRSGSCTTATQITRINYAKGNRTHFKSDLSDLIVGEYVDSAFLERFTDKFNGWRTRSLERIQPLIRQSLREIKEYQRSGLPFNHLSSTSLRTRVNFLMESQLYLSPWTAEENFLSHRHNARMAFRRPALRPRVCRVPGIDPRMLEKSRNLPGQMHEMGALAVKHFARFFFKVEFPGT